ncbi:MAG: hypothetical protein KJO34_05250, partial [Deltaproteobacteria bacterium]|nr:hypothetical protein [Deltaproteobacteria bacterium]
MNIERRTSNVQHRMKNKHPIPNIAEFRFLEKAPILRKSKISNPKSKIATPIADETAQPTLRPYRQPGPHNQNLSIPSKFVIP